MQVSSKIQKKYTNFLNANFVGFYMKKDVLWEDICQEFIKKKRRIKRKNNSNLNNE